MFILNIRQASVFSITCLKEPKDNLLLVKLHPGRMCGTIKGLLEADAAAGTKAARDLDRQSTHVCLLSFCPSALLLNLTIILFFKNFFKLVLNSFPLTLRALSIYLLIL